MRAPGVRRVELTDAGHRLLAHAAAIPRASRRGASRYQRLDHLLPPRRLGLYERAEGYRAPAVALVAAAIRGAALQAA